MVKQINININRPIIFPNLLGEAISTKVLIY